jgi:hypothetical protein
MTLGRGRRAVFVGVVAALGGLVAVPVSVAAPRTATLAPRTVDVFGDSLMEQAAAYLQASFNTHTTLVRVAAYGGSALCAWVYPDMTSSPTGLTMNTTPGPIMALTSSNAPNVAILEFVGNPFSTCVSGASSSITEVVANYSLCLSAAIHHLLSIGTSHIIVDGGPAMKEDNTLHDAVVALFKSVVGGYDSVSVQYAATADASVEAHGAYTQYLPCLTIETLSRQCAATDVGGVASNDVRSTDGVHFCPSSKGNVEGQVPIYCPVYSSGSYRYATAFAQMVWKIYPATAITQNIVVWSISPTSGAPTGGTKVTVHGYNLAHADVVEFVKLYRPVVNGIVQNSASPRVVIVRGTDVKVLTSGELTVISPNLDATSPPDNGNVFIRIVTPTAESVIGTNADGFTET